MKDEVLISVITPMYNAKEFIAETIQSVLDQTYQNWEMIIVDNCSTDNCKEMVTDIIKKDYRMRLIELEYNSGGPARPRNIGLDNAKGEYIAFLDADDIWYSNKLEVCKKYLNDDVDVLYHDLVIFGNKKKYVRKKLRGRKLKEPILVDLLVNGNAILNSSAVVRLDVITKVNYLDESVEVIAAEDFNLWLKIAYISQSFKYIPIVLGKYFVGDDNMSSKNMSSCVRFASDGFVNKLNGNQFMRYNSIMEYTNGRYLYLNNETEKSVKHLVNVLSNGTYEMKIKSLYMLCIIYFRRINF